MSQQSSQTDDQSGRLERLLLDQGLRLEDDGVVRWKTDTSGHPRQWPQARKLYDTTVIIILEGFMTLFSNVGTSCAEYAQEHFGISRVSAIAAFTTTYLLGQAFGGLMLAPFTETFGRKRSYIVAAFFYCVSCIILAAPNSLPAVIVGRIMSGVASSMGSTVAAGSLEDIWDEFGRIWSIWIWCTAAVVPLGLAPLIGTYISTSSLGWRWIFYIAAIIWAVLTISTFGLQESQPSNLISHKLHAVHKRHGQSTICSNDSLRPQGQQGKPSLQTFVSDNLGRPVVLLLTEPILIAVTTMISVSYATIYLLPEALTVVYGDFGFSARQSSLTSLAISIGPVLSSLTRVLDTRIARRQARNDIELQPEAKLTGFYIAAPLLAVSIWWFAWTIPPIGSASAISPFVSMAALILVGFATLEFDYVLSGYITDTYGTYAASANAPLGFVRAVLSGTFPLFGEQMFRSLGNNIAGTVLAIIATAFCVVAVGFWKFGRRLRMASSFANEHT